MVKEDWRLHVKRADFEAIGNKYGFDKVIAKLIRNRDVITDEEFEEYINGDIKDMHSPLLMKDMKKAVDIIKKAIDYKKKIRIIGDYDIDGINSIYILYSGLSRLGADVDYVVPHRITDGYGINEALVKDAYDAGREIIITCDNGIAAFNQIVYAKELGLTVVVTDHHDVPFEEKADGRKYVIPPADAVIDIKQEDCEYPFKHICGAVVAYKLIQALFAECGMAEDAILDYIEFAAIATIGDVMDLQGENRIIVKNGLRKIRNTSNIGLNALIEINGLDKNAISSYHIGFVIGPCLNASGRLDTAMQAVKLLLTDSMEEARGLAGELKELNEERKSLTQKGLEKAIECIEGSDIKDDMVLVVYIPGCHESIVGIIAGKIRERYNKPVIVFADGEGCLKGSGRSTECYNMFEKISECKHLLDKFGGHPMAAGMSIQPDKLEEFRNLLNVNSGMTEDDLTLKVWIDVAMPIDYIREDLISQISILEPFGKGNEKPVFADRNLFVKSLAYLGKEKKVLKVLLQNQSGYRIEGIMFTKNQILEEAYNLQKPVNIIYYPAINEFRGNRTMQVVINNVKETTV